MPSKKSNKRGPGQPTKYRPEYCQMLIEHMQKVHSFESFAAVINTDRSTLYNWCKDHREFFDARKKGREQAQIGLENIGKGLMTGKVKGNVAAWIFFMKNLTGWRDDLPPEEEEIEGIDFI